MAQTLEHAATAGGGCGEPALPFGSRRRRWARALPPGATASAGAVRVGRHQRHERLHFLDTEAHLLVHTEDKVRIVGHPHELERHVRGDDKFDRGAAERYYHAVTGEKRRRTKQWTA